MKILISIPLLIISVIVFNVTLLSKPGSLDVNTMPFFSMSLPSDNLWHALKGDFIVMGAIILFFIDILKSARFSKGGLIKHGLSLLLLITLLVEFMVWPAAANSTCVILMLICLLDLIAGFIFKSTTTRKDFNLGGIH